MNDLDVAIEAARAAGSLLVRAYQEGPTRVTHKGAVDLVTEVDQACEAAVRQFLHRHTPDMAVLGEEGGGAFEATTRWIVDPLDGTTNFVHGFPWFCVSIGLEVDGVREVGVILDPLRDRLFSARRGHGAHCNGVRLRVSAVDTLEQALIATGFPYDRQQRAAFYLARVERVLQRAQGLRRAGAAALDLALVAAGQLDAYWEFSLQPWDAAAGLLLVEEAGGRVSNHEGGPIDPRRPSVLASNGPLHDAMVSVLAQPGT